MGPRSTAQPGDSSSTYRWAAAATVALLAAGTLTGLAVPAGALSPSHDPAAASPTIQAATALATAKATGKPVQITALTTATDTVSADPSGTITMTSTLLPTRIKHGNAWTTIDPTLTRTANGAIAPTAVPSGLTLSPGGGGPLVTMTNAGHRLSLSWPGSLPNPTLSGATATYADVLPDVDLAVTANTLGGFSDVLIVKTAAAALNPALASLRFTTSTDGVTITADPTNDLKIADPAGNLAFVASTPKMWDSTTAATPQAKDGAADNPEQSTTSNIASGITGPGDGARVASADMQVSGDNISLTPNRDLLTGTQTDYPLFAASGFNPASVGSSRQAFVEVQEGCPDTKSNWNSTQYAGDPAVGYNDDRDCIGQEQSYFQFGVNSRIWNTTATKVEVISATLKIMETSSSSCSITANVKAYRTDGISSATTWNHRPTVDELQDTTAVGPACSSEPSAGFDVKSAYTWASINSKSAVTLGLFPENVTAAANRKRFETNPSVTITFDSKPTVTAHGTIPTTACSGATIGATPVTLTASVNDVDASAPVQAFFSIKRSDGTSIAANAQHVAIPQTNIARGPVTQRGALTFALGVLPSGTYSWSVHANDYRNSSAETATCTFTVDSTAPAPPQITSTDYPDPEHQDPAGPPAARNPGTFTFTPSDKDVVRYAYNWGTPPPALDPPLFFDATKGGGQTVQTLIPMAPTSDMLYAYAIDSQGNESPVTSYSFNTAPLSGPDATGDFTGDQKADLLFAGSDGNIRLYPGSANGTLGQPNHLTTDSGFKNAVITAGDFDWDYIQDLLARKSDGSLAYYSGNGAGAALVTNAAVPVDSPHNDDETVFPWSSDQQIVGTLDVNNDGNYPDIFAVSGDALWFIPAGGGPGIFEAPQLVSDSGWANSTIADAGTSGGYPALWARNKVTGELDLYTGSNQVPAGSAISIKTVVAASGWTTALHPMVQSAGDANTDGTPDLWATNTEPFQEVLYYPTTAASTLGTPSRVQNLNPQGDLTGDGEADILAIDTAGNQYIYPGTNHLRTESFTTRYLTGVGWSGKDYVSVGDINGDGRPDILARSSSDQSLSVYPNTGGSGTSTFGAPYLVGQSWGNKNILELGDVNGDGKVDILARNISDSSLWVYPNTGGTGTNTFGTPYLVGLSWGNESYIRLGDFNHDGKIDLHSIDGSGDQWVYPGTGGTGTSTFGTRYQTGAQWGGKDAISISDVDSDGMSDILARNTSDDSLWVYPGTNKGGTSSFGTPYKVGEFWGNETVII